VIRTDLGAISVIAFRCDECPPWCSTTMRTAPTTAQAEAILDRNVEQRPMRYRRFVEQVSRRRRVRSGSTASLEAACDVELLSMDTDLGAAR
jgi:hypothetical protein